MGGSKIEKFFDAEGKHPKITLEGGGTTRDNQKQTFFYWKTAFVDFEFYMYIFFLVFFLLKEQILKCYEKFFNKNWCNWVHNKANTSRISSCFGLENIREKSGKNRGKMSLRALHKISASGTGIVDLLSEHLSSSSGETLHDFRRWYWDAKLRVPVLEFR